MPRPLKTFSFLCAVLAMIAVLGIGNVQAEVELRLEFVSFNDDLSQYVVVVEDNQQGRTVQIRDTETGAIKKSYFVTDPRDENKRIRRLRRRFPVDGHIGQVGPKKRHTIMGAPEGQKGYDLIVKRGKRFGTLKTIPLKTGDDGETTAVGMLKTVVWAPSGRFILAIVNQTQAVGNDKDDIDGIHYVPFKHWKIRWYRTEQEKTGDGS